MSEHVTMLACLSDPFSGSVYKFVIIIGVWLIKFMLFTFAWRRHGVTVTVTRLGFSVQPGKNCQWDEWLWLHAHTYTFPFRTGFLQLRARFCSCPVGVTAEPEKPSGCLRRFGAGSVTAFNYPEWSGGVHQKGSLKDRHSFISPFHFLNTHQPNMVFLAALVKLMALLRLRVRP